MLSFHALAKIGVSLGIIAGTALAAHEHANTTAEVTPRDDATIEADAHIEATAAMHADENVGTRTTVEALLDL